ncbi:Transposon Tf2-6 polyprotein [Actinidia chinensis var. chinensis]|uniref:Transposon Tf2-6 polyprotein n=1 Tax=Actinidia chinensis var. chinensis TaxID=1590841 RepID=A0A2R6P6L1_ACTCC|nr:Transposon Tf2-6 polyprotein [Actinidia chinensis var. chinensis]
MTPFQALYGRLPPIIPQYQVGNSPVYEVNQNLASRYSLLRQLKDNLHATSNRMKQVADSKGRDIEFEEGHLIFLKLHPYRQQTVFKRAYQKLASRFYGPYLIEKRVGKVAYRLQLPEGSRIHPIFHVSLLKKKMGEAYATSNDLPPITNEGEFIMEPEGIVDS